MPAPRPTRRPWADICADELAWIIDAAREGVPGFVTWELRPLGRNLLRAVNITTAARDLYRIAHHSGELFLSDDPPPPLVLASEEQLARAFARWCLGADSLNTFLAETFGFLHDALTRRHGEAAADALIRDAIATFAPARLAALHLLTVGPRTVRVFSGPTAHMTVPALWLAASIAAGQRRTEHQLDLEDLSHRVKNALSIEVQPRGALPSPIQTALGLLGIIFGAGAIATAAYRTLDMNAQYLTLLDQVQHLLLHGSTDPDAEPLGPGLLQLLEDLEHAGPPRSPPPP